MSPESQTNCYLCAYMCPTCLALPLCKCMTPLNPKVHYFLMEYLLDMDPEKIDEKIDEHR